MKIIERMFEGIDFADMVIFAALGFLLITFTMGYSAPDAKDMLPEWIGLIIAYLIGKKTPSKL
jgi:hypothetical protein